MAHPYGDHKSLHTKRVARMLGGYAAGKGAPKADHSYMPKAGASKMEAEVHGGKPKGRADKFKRGGAVKGKIIINIVAGGQDKPVPVPVPAGGPPPGPMAGAPPMPPPGAAGPAPAMPMPHKNGGRAFKRGGKVGPTWREGIKNGTKVQHAGQNDAKDINRPPVITKASGGKVGFGEKMKFKTIDDGAGGGLGRLEKIKAYGAKAKK